MKKVTKKIMILLSLVFSLISCSNETDNLADNDFYPITILNGGFESSNLSGWEIEYGNAYNDDSVASHNTFIFPNDDKNTEIPIGKQGNWYLSGKGFDGTFSHGRIGAIRSTKFVLSGDGTISFKLAGGALTRGRGVEVENKKYTELCYLGVYTTKDDRLVAMKHNEYFLEHTEEYVDLNKYKNGVYATDNFVDYTLELTEYIGEEMYIRIVDNDKDVYYGYLSVDDIRIGGEIPQEEGQYFIKTHSYIEDVEATSEFEIKNGDFEIGSLAGWTVLDGQAFSNEGVNQEETWWNENISYEREGNYHYGHYKPSATGRMRSSSFILGGSGYVSFKLGGCSNNDLTYLSFYVVEDGEVEEVARYSNRKYWNFQFPYVENGMRLLNLVQYVADLTQYIGKTMFIEVVDLNSSSDELGCITLDSIFTYYLEKPMFYEIVHFEAHSIISTDVIVDSIYQIENGSFETGDLTGWTTSYQNDDDRIGEVTNKNGWWYENFPFNKKGNYLFSGENVEANTGYIQSSSFKVGGIGKMSFLIGGGNDPRKCYISLFDSENDEELVRYSNRYFHDIGTELINRGSNLMNMVQYVADISEYMDKELYIRVSDYSTSDWGLITVDSFITYYEDENALPLNAYEAIDISSKEAIGNEYQVLNGNFETGDLTGWELSSQIGGIAYNEVWWHEWYSFEKEGNYFFSGWRGSETATGTLTSTAFTVGGINKITFRLGGAKNNDVCYIAIIDANTSQELIKFGNHMFNDHMTYYYYYNGSPITLSQDDVYMANMVLYVADLSALAGRSVKIKVVDNATNDWGLVFVDDFVTYYESEADLPLAIEAN